MRIGLGSKVVLTPAAELVWLEFHSSKESVPEAGLALIFDS